MKQNVVIPSIFLIIYLIAASVFLLGFFMQGINWVMGVGFIVSVAMILLKVKQIKDIKARENQNI